MVYAHRLDGSNSDLPIGKVVCVGRNYAEHARELNNPIPTEPLLFIKPATAIVPMEQPFTIPADRGSCHIETEMALLIGVPLTSADTVQAVAAVVGVGLGFDLTLRDLQNDLKAKGLPWEKAKGFDGGCPLSGFVSAAGVDFGNIDLRLTRNGELQQQGNSGDMLTPVAELLSYISGIFTLMPGDIVLTGTPAGVGPLDSGDQLTAELGCFISVNTRVVT